MTEHSQNSPPAERPSKTTEAPSARLTAFRKELEDQGVNHGCLAIFNFCTGEQIFGEVGNVETHTLCGVPILVKNPKRFIRIQRAERDGGISIEFLVADLDMIEEGAVVLQAPLAYWIDYLSCPSQERYLGTYLMHLEQKKLMRAAASGIVSPAGFKMPNLRGP